MKIYFTKKENEALLQRARGLRKDRMWDPDMVYFRVKTCKECERLNMLEKYTKMKLINKLKKHIKNLSD